MDESILVPLRSSDRVEQFLPYIEQVVKPGMKIVFLVPYGSDGFAPLLDKLLVLQTGIDPEHLPGRSKPQDLLEERQHVAMADLLPACAGLRTSGIDIGVNVYVGRLRDVVQGEMQKGNVHLVMMRLGSENLLTRLLYKIGAFARFLSSPTFPPVLLLHPSPISERTDAYGKARVQRT